MLIALMLNCTQNPFLFNVLVNTFLKKINFLLGVSSFATITLFDFKTCANQRRFAIGEIGSHFFGSETSLIGFLSIRKTTAQQHRLPTLMYCWPENFRLLWLHVLLCDHLLSTIDPCEYNAANTFCSFF